MSSLPGASDESSDGSSGAMASVGDLGIGFGVDQFVRLPHGRFIMGSEIDAENPPHEVELRKSFHLQRTPVTQAQWTAIMGENPSRFQGDERRPVENVSWERVQEFLAALSSATGVHHRLPTDAEWEYACRAGGSGQLAGDLDAQMWYRTNSGGTPHAVAAKQPNAWGLYDMHGNVSEWVHDYYGPLDAFRVVDPVGIAFGTTRVVRGGSWFNQAVVARGIPRGSLDETECNEMTGFRLVRVG